MINTPPYIFFLYWGREGSPKTLLPLLLWPFCRIIEPIDRTFVINAALKNIIIIIKNIHILRYATK